MYWTTVFVPVSVFLSIAPRLAFATLGTHLCRRDSDALGSLDEFCANFEIHGQELTALCIASIGVPNEANIDLNRCLANRDGQLQFERNGNAFSTCTKCSLEALDLTCACVEDKGPASGSRVTRIGLGNMLFATVDGQIACS